MAKKSFLLITLLTILALVVAGCDFILGIGNMQGEVTDKSNGARLEGVKISTDPETKDTVTDSEGNYVISDISSGDYIIKASRDEYNPATKSVSVNPGEVAQADIELIQNRLPVLEIEALKTKAGLFSSRE